MAFPTIVDINVVSSTLVKVTFTDEVVTNSEYYDVANYVFSGGLVPVKVLETNKTSSVDIIINTQPMVVGTTYTLTMDNIINRAGDVASSVSGDFEARVTKLDSILKSIPKHYDKRNVSLIHAFLSAFSDSDDQIGGSRDDSITFS